MRRPPITKWLQRRLRDQRGVVLVLVAMLMVVFLGMAAVAIDVGFLYQQKSKAQSAADAAALAGAQDLPGNATLAATDAQNYVASNMSGATSVVTTPYNSSASQIKVTVNQTVPNFFGQIFGSGSTNVSASAVAAETAGASASCSTPGTGCAAIFAMDSSCSHAGISLGGGEGINGGVQSNGALNVGGGGSSFGPTTYGTGCTVSPSKYASQGNTFTSGPTPTAPVTTWPIDYRTDFPACTGSACTGRFGTPSFCTNATLAASEILYSYYPNTLISGQIYCDVGSGTPGDPATWNGAITANQSGNGFIESSFVAGSVTLGGGVNLEACGYSSAGYTASGCSTPVPPATTNYPLIYVTGTSSNAVDESSGGAAFLGDLFAPNGTILLGGGTGTSFLEAQDVVATKGALTYAGDGPSSSGSGSSSASGSLIQ